MSGPITFSVMRASSKKQGAVSHSSSEAEVIALDACVRTEGIPALILWEEIQNTFAGRKAPEMEKKSKINGMYDILNEVDFVPSNLPKSGGKSKLVIAEDNDAVINMSIKGRSPNMKHCPRVHRVDLDFLFERIREDPGITIRYCETAKMLADMLTKGSFTEKTWRVLCDLCRI